MRREGGVHEVERAHEVCAPSALELGAHAVRAASELEQEEHARAHGVELQCRRRLALRLEQAVHLGLQQRDEAHGEREGERRVE